jgi:hypothetical protein
LFVFTPIMQGNKMCIELLEKCRATKQANGAAIHEVGRLFGEAFERGWGHESEVQKNHLDKIEQFTIENLKLSFLGGRPLFAKAFEPAIQRNNGSYTLGLRFSSDSGINMPGCEVVLDEPSFVKGFVEGFKQSQTRRTTNQS